MSDRQYIDAARSGYADEGRIEIDDNAIISRNDELTSDHGAYVQAWVWVDDPEPHADAEHTTLPAAIAARLAHDKDTSPLAFCTAVFNDNTVALQQTYRARLRRVMRRLGFHKTK